MRPLHPRLRPGLASGERVTKPKCQWCKKREVGDAFVCSPCMDLARKALRNVAVLEVELPIAITRQTRYQPKSETKGNTETPVMFNVKASTASHSLRNTLSTWCRVYAEECRADPPRDTLTAMSAFLLSRAEWFRHHRSAVQFLDEVTRDVAEAIRQIDTPENRTVFAVGPCPETTEDSQHCPGIVKAYFPTDDRPHLTCSACKTVWFGESWLRTGKRILARHAELKPVPTGGG